MNPLSCLWRPEIICDFFFFFYISSSSFHVLSHTCPQTLLICPQSFLGIFCSFFFFFTSSSLRFTPAADSRGFNFKRNLAFATAALCSSSVLHLLLTLLFLLCLFLLMCRVFPGVAAAAARRRTAAPVPGAAAVAAAWGAWGWEGASAGGAPSRRTRWSCRRRSLVLRLLAAALLLWSPAGKFTPPTSRETSVIKWAEPVRLLIWKISLRIS